MRMIDVSAIEPLVAKMAQGLIEPSDYIFTKA
jgi:hypothetical protein